MSRPYFFQEAYFVPSIDEAARKWARDFGAGPFFVARRHRCDQFDYRGSDTQASVSYAFGYLGDMMIQFIEQHDELPSIYMDMFKPGEMGFHHVGFLVSDFAAERQRWLDAGYELATELYADEVNAAYFDTRELNGAFTEIHGDPVRILGTFATWKRTHEQVDPRETPIIDREDFPHYRSVPILGQ